MHEGATYDGVDTVVLHNELAIDDVFPCAWRALATPLSPAMLNRHAESNLRVLQFCTALDDLPQSDKNDEQLPQAADLARLDLKLNLLLDMVSRMLAQNQPRPPAMRLRFNARGATWKLTEPAPKLGDEGIVEIYLKDYLVEPLCLAGRANASADGLVQVSFHPPGDAIADLIEKWVFKKHRRQVADLRQPRGARP